MTDDEKELHDAAIGQVLPEGDDVGLSSPSGAGHLIGETDHSPLARGERPMHLVVIPALAGGGEQRDLFATGPDADRDRFVLHSLVLAAGGAGDLQDRQFTHQWVEFERGQDRPAKGQPRAKQRGSLSHELEHVQVGQDVE